MSPSNGIPPAGPLAPSRYALAALAILLVTLAALGAGHRWGALLAKSLSVGGDEAARGRTVVEFWSGWTGREARIFQGLVDRFNREQPTLWVHNFGGVQDDAKTVRAITAGVPPDACFLWNPGYLGPLAANGALRALNDRL